MRYVLATLACLIIVIVWVTISGAMKWNIFGGFIVQGIGIVILIYTWRAIVKKGEKNNQIDIQKEDDLNSSTKDDNTHNISRSDNAEIVSKPFKKQLIKQDNDMESTIGDEEFYLTATKEVDGKGLDEALWAKCLAIFKGDEKIAKYDYIEKRVTILRQKEVDRIDEEKKIVIEKAKEDERVAKEDERVAKEEKERKEKEKIDKERGEREKERVKRQKVREEEWAEVQKAERRISKEDKARNERRGKAIRSFLKKRWKPLLVFLALIIAYNFITSDNTKPYTEEKIIDSVDNKPITSVNKNQPIDGVINNNTKKNLITLKQLKISNNGNKERGSIEGNTSRLKQKISWSEIADSLLDRSDAQTQYEVGMTFLGGGNEEDDKSAFVHLKLAANKGHTKAQYNLGWMYKDGKGVLQDDKQAVKWYRKAANQGYAEAQFNLGWMYAKGKGVQSDKKAMLWYEKSALQGIPQAAYNLGLMYTLDNNATVKDRDKAFYWLNKAEENGWNVTIRDKELFLLLLK